MLFSLSIINDEPWELTHPTVARLNTKTIDTRTSTHKVFSVMKLCLLENSKISNSHEGGKALIKYQNVTTYHVHLNRFHLKKRV
jgi:hypothetical protein